MSQTAARRQAMMTANPANPDSGQSGGLGPYGRWVRAWTRYMPLVDQPSRLSLMDLDRWLVGLVAERVEVFEAGLNVQLEFPAGGTVEEMAIAAELGPLLETLGDLGVTESRELTSGEAELLACRSWGDRPSLGQLRELGQDLAELVAAGMSPWEERGFTPTAFLPSELRVIAEAAELTVEAVYQR